jgi:hypothetical protein
MNVTLQKFRVIVTFATVKRRLVINFISYLIICLFGKSGERLFNQQSNQSNVWMPGVRGSDFPLFHTIQIDWDPHKFVQSGYRGGLFYRDRYGRGVKILHLLLSIRMCGTVLLLPCTSLWRGA